MANTIACSFTTILEPGLVLTEPPQVRIENVTIRNMMTKIYIIMPRQVFDDYQIINLMCDVKEVRFQRTVDIVPFTVTPDNLVFELYDCNYILNELLELNFTLTADGYVGQPDVRRGSMSSTIQRFTTTVSI